MDKQRNWILRLFLVLFSLSVSVTVLPGWCVNTHGFFGEVVASTITEDQNQNDAKIKAQYTEKIQKIKGINIFNIWFELWILIVCIGFIAYRIRLPREENIVTLKVRMDD